MVSLVGPQPATGSPQWGNYPGSPNEEPHPFFHDGLDRGSKMADEDPLGGGVALVFTAPADYGEGIAG